MPHSWGQPIFWVVSCFEHTSPTHWPWDYVPRFRSGHSSPCSCCQPPATCATAHCTSTCPCYFLFAVTNQCCKFQTPPTISMFALTFYCSHACCLLCYAHTWFSEVCWFFVSAGYCIAFHPCNLQIMHCPHLLLILCCAYMDTVPPWILAPYDGSGSIHKCVFVLFYPEQEKGLVGEVLPGFTEAESQWIHYRFSELSVVEWSQCIFLAHFIVICPFMQCCLLIQTGEWESAQFTIMAYMTPSACLCI